jgi:amidase
MNAAIAILLAEGAVVEEITAPAGQLGSCVAYPYPVTPRCSSVLIYGQKRDLNAYLASTPDAPMRNIAEIVAFNATYVPPMKYGQAIFEAAAQVDVTPGSADTIRYQADRAYDLANSRVPLDAIYARYDAILASANSFAGAPAKAGYPSITVPGGFLPATEALRTFPSGVTFSGPAFSEPKLIGFAYAFEQATRHRRPPFSTPALPTDTVVRP